MTTLLYRLFRVGQLPREERPRLEAEGIVLSDEGVNGSITYEKFTGLGMTDAYRTSRFSGSLVVTQTRFAVYAANKDLVNMLLTDLRMQKLRVTTDGENVLLIAFEASDLNSDQTGTVEIWLWTAQARIFLAKLAPLTT